MLKLPPLATLILGIAFAAAARAQDSSEPWPQLLKALEAELHAKTAAPDPASSAMPGVRSMLLAQLRGAVAGGDALALETALNQVSAYIPSDELRAQCEQLVVKLHGTRVALEKKTLEDISAALGRAGEAVRSAKNAADLDGVLHELGVLSERRNAAPSSNAISTALNKIEPTMRFVARWQDFLANSASGNAQAAREALRNLADNSSSNQPDLIPRSEILARMGDGKMPARDTDSGAAIAWDNLKVKEPLHLDPATGIVSFRIYKLEELDGLVNALENLQRQSVPQNFSRFVSDSLASLLPLRRAHEELKAGLSTNIQIASSGTHPSTLETELIPIRAELILLALPRYLGLPGETKPKPGEGPHDFLDRVTAEAVTRGDYLLAARAREAQRLLRERKVPDPDEKTQAQLFVTAQNQEAAGEHALAVASYEKALASGTDLVPPKIIGERLAAIKASHADEFQKGMELFLTPPVPRYPPGYPPGWPPGRAGIPDRPTPAPVLAVPAVSPAPTPTPK